jgi:predicted heme/steroid binding protein
MSVAVIGCINRIVDRVFTEQELMRYDGSRVNPVYIAYKGMVHDVTSSPHSHTGGYRNLH